MPSSSNVDAENSREKIDEILMNIRSWRNHDDFSAYPLSPYAIMSTEKFLVFEFFHFGNELFVC